MIEATKDMFKKYCVFEGRTSRADFWWAVLGYFILSMIVGFVVGFIVGLAGLGNNTLANLSASTVISGVWGLATILPVLGMEVRRLHDINYSGWLVLLCLIPFVGGIILLVFFCLPTVNEGNKY